MANTDVEVTLQSCVGTMDDLVDRKRRCWSIRIGLVMAVKFLFDPDQPALQFNGLSFLLAGIAVYYRVEIALNYNWNWGKIPQFLFRFDEESGKWVSNVLMWGLFNTIRLSIFGTILAIILGTIMGICRSSKVVFFSS